MRFFEVLGLACLAMGAELVYLNTITWHNVIKEADKVRGSLQVVENFIPRQNWPWNSQEACL
jgi:exo-beta-1,3-glucanase (GH17 family)